MPHEQDDVLLTTREAAGLLTMSTTWLYKNRAALGIPCIRLGAELRYRKSALLRWLAGQER